MKVERIQLQTGVVYGNRGEGVRVSSAGDSPHKRHQGRQKLPQDENTATSEQHTDAEEVKAGGSDAEPTKGASDHVLDITA